MHLSPTMIENASETDVAMMLMRSLSSIVEISVWAISERQLARLACNLSLAQVR